MQHTQQIGFVLAAALGLLLPPLADAAGARPRQGAELRYGITTEPATLDPLSPANTADGRSILFNVFEGLVRPDASGRLVPAAAESFSVEQGGRVYVFTLRRGLRFHDGTLVSPSDVVFSLLQAKAAGFPGLLAVQKVEASGAVVQVTLEKSDNEFLPYLTVGIVPEANPDREKNPVGTGPFSIEGYTPQGSLVLKKNPAYWQSGLPHLDRVTVVFTADSDGLLTGLRGGNIEGASVTGSLVAQLDQAGFDIVPGHSNTVQLLALNNQAGPLADLRVRQALNYAVNVPELITTAFYGMGEPSGSPLIPGLAEFYEEALRDPYPQDLARAKRLLAGAGYPGGFDLEITVPSNYTMHVDTAQVLVNQLASAGIRASIRLVDWATWLAEVYRGRRFQGTIISLDANNVSPRSFLSRYLSGAGGNFINFNNPAYDRVYQAALEEPDGKRRAALYREAQRLISENAARVYIQDIMAFKVFAGKRFGGVVNYPLYVVDFSTIYRLDTDGRK
jgi:peptide/nickel transport system substrate-binding protein